MKYWSSSLILGLTLITLLLSSFRHAVHTNPPTGTIEGYILPKLARPYAQIAVPNPGNPVDTIHKDIQPNAEGYFKIPNLGPGSYTLIFMAKEKGFKHQLKNVAVQANVTTSAGKIILEKMLQ